jgi:apolipoprotein N-acyltransferase
VSAHDPLAAAQARLRDGNFDLAVSTALGVLEESAGDERLEERAIALLTQCAEALSERANTVERPKRAAREIYRRLAERCDRLGLAPEALDAFARARALGAEDAETAAAIAQLRRRARRRLLRDGALALLAASLILAGTPPLGAWPLGLLGLALLLLLAREASVTRASALGWLCGFAINAVGFAWGADLLRRFVHVGPATAFAAVAGLAAYQAGVFALWLGAATFLRRRFGLVALVAAPLVVVIAEAAVPFVFPWYLALIAASAWPLAQIAELGGPPAVSGLLVLIAGLVAEGCARLAPLARALELRRAGATPRALRAGAIVVVGILGLGLARAAHVATARAAAKHERVGVVQPNVGLAPPKERARRADAELGALRRATEEASRAGADLVVWPESAFPFLFDRDLPREYPEGHPWALHPGHHGRLLFGALSHQFGTGVVYNSVALVRADGRVAGLYDKNRLLAFGEYVPFAERYPEWAARTRARMDEFPEIVPGRELRLLVDGDLRLGLLVCYEDLLPEHVHEVALLGANLLVTSANHAWFAGSLAPRQAEMLAIFRGIETRRDLVRATMTGESSISDALGRIQRESATDASVPEAGRAPEVLVADVALLEIFALGPRTVRYFPWACAVGLLTSIALAVTARRRAAPPTS